MICLLSNALSAASFDVHLISWDAEGASAFYALNSDVVWHRLGYQQGWADKLRRTRLLAHLLRRTDARALVGFVMSGDKTIYAAARLTGVRLIAAERNGPAMYRLRYGRVERWVSFGLLHLADRIVVQLPEFRAGYPRSLRARIGVIPNPVVTAEHRAMPHRPDANGRFTLLATSRLDCIQKRIDRLIGAFSRIAADFPNWDLRIIGDGPNEGALRQLTVERGIHERVFFEASTPDVFTSYASSHLFAIPSRWEGFPNALAEAMSHGLPAVGFRDAEGVSNLVDDGESGWLADGVDDEISLSRVLAVAMADDAERARRGAIAVTRMAAYAPEVQFERWVALLDPIVATSGR
jgi:glycosyltransferase involved in cell wall biosynthesis